MRIKLTTIIRGLSKEENMNLLLRGKVAVITGSTANIGRTGAILFAQEGARVIITGRSEERGQEVVRTIKEQGNEASFIRADLQIVADIERLIRMTVETYGRLDIFWHNAGIIERDDIENITEETYDKSMTIDLKASVFGTKFAIPEIRKAGGGSILFTGSVAGLKQSSYSLTYSLSKTGLIMLTKKLAVDLAKDNIRVNCICPGRVENRMSTTIFEQRAQEKGIDLEDFIKWDMQRIPLGRFITQKEIADTALFLVSDIASAITGVALPVDGGFLAV